MFLRRFSLKTRFVLTMAIMAGSLLGLGAWGVIANRASIGHVAQHFDQAQGNAEAVARLRESIANLRRLQANIIAVGASNAVEVERLIGLWKTELDVARRHGAALGVAGQGAADLDRLVKVLGEQLVAYASGVRPIVEQLQAAKIDSAAALAYAEQVEDKAAALLKTADAILKATQQRQAEIRQTMAQTTTLVSNLRLLLIGVTLAIVMPLLWLTLRSVCGPLEQAVRVAGRIAQGDLSESLKLEGRDETATLLESLQRMQESLRQLVGQVRVSAESIRSASAEVATGNQDLSHRTEEAASSLQLTASSVQQLHAAVSSSAESARQANGLASDATEVARRGGQIVSQVVTTMDGINNSSRRIADIIGVIDGIAFQTNILALNAAVEAARAGEQGRGFAVVASEVRLLAQRSADAASEIKILIGASVEQVGAGAKLVDSAGSAMTEIVDSVRRVAQTIDAVTRAAGEQSAGLGQVNHAVADLDRMTQQNAALVEQSATAAESLNQQAARLTGLVATFRLGV